MAIDLPGATVIVALGIAPPLCAQAPPAGPTTIQYYRDNVQVGSDEYSIRQQGGDNLLRSRVTVRQRGERVATEITFDSLWRPRQIQMEVRGAANFNTGVQFGPRRITFRSASPAGESAREVPRPRVVVLVDDDMPSLYTVLQYVEPGEVTTFRIRTAATAAATLVDHGLTAAPSDSPGLRWRHLELRADDGVHHAWFDETGQLVSVEQPARHYRATPTRGE